MASMEQPEPAPVNEDGQEGAEADTLPEYNALYKRKEYWDRRFEGEESYEWLVAYGDVKGLLAEYLVLPTAETVSGRLRVLVVGCGNSSFSADLVSKRAKLLALIGCVTGGNDSSDRYVIYIHSMRTCAAAARSHP